MQLFTKLYLFIDNRQLDLHNKCHGRREMCQSQHRTIFEFFAVWNHGKMHLRYRSLAGLPIFSPISVATVERLGNSLCWKKLNVKNDICICMKLIDGWLSGQFSLFTDRPSTLNKDKTFQCRFLVKTSYTKEAVANQQPREVEFLPMVCHLHFDAMEPSLMFCLAERLKPKEVLDRRGVENVTLKLDPHGRIISIDTNALSNKYSNYLNQVSECFYRQPWTWFYFKFFACFRTWLAAKFCIYATHLIAKYFALIWKKRWKWTKERHASIECSSALKMLSLWRHWHDFTR